MIERTLSGGEVLLLGAVRGFVAEVTPLLARLDRFRPSALGLGLSPAELRGLEEHFVGRGAEPLVPLTAAETAEVTGLSRYGEARVPNPAFVGALEWARPRGVPVEALDLADDVYADLFTEHIGYVELVRRTLAERRLTRTPPAPPSADEYALAWERGIARGAASRRFLEARAKAIADAVRALGARRVRAAVVVDRERFDAVAAAL